MLHESAQAGLAPAQVHALERSHRRPAQPQGVRHDRVEAGGVDDSRLNEVDGLPQHRVLEAVAHEAPRLAGERHRSASVRAVRRERSVDGLGRGPLSRHHFDERHDVRRVEGVSDEHAGGRVVVQRRRDARGQDRRRRGQQQRVLRRGLGQLDEQRRLVLRALGSALLHEVRTVRRVRRGVRAVDGTGRSAGGSGRGPRDLLEVGARVEDAHAGAVGGEKPHPGQADRAGADDGDAGGWLRAAGC